MIIKNVGPIKMDEITLNNGIFLIGENNSGKTYLSYLLYGILSYFKSIKIDIFSEDEVWQLINENELKIDLNVFLKRVSKYIINDLHENQTYMLKELFKENISEFEKSEIIISEEEITQFISKMNSSDTNYTFIRSDTLQELDLNFLVFKTSLKDNYMIMSFDFKMTRKFFSKFVMPEDPTEGIEVENLKSKMKLDKLLGSSLSLGKLISEMGLEHDFLFREINSSMMQSIQRVFAYDTVYIPSERIGINTFIDELIMTRASASDRIANDNSIGFYTKPINDYINGLNEFIFFEKSKKEDKIQILEDTNTALDFFYENILKGRYVYEEDNNAFVFNQLERTKDDKEYFSSEAIQFLNTSSSSKSLFGLDSLLQINGRRQLIFIDEPEMNLDNRTQKHMATYLLMHIRAGNWVVVSTHSDVIMRSTINHLLKDQIEKGTLSESINVYQTGHNQAKYSEKIDIVNNYSISNFDNPLLDIDDEYYSLLRKLDEIRGDI